MFMVTVASYVRTMTFNSTYSFGGISTASVFSLQYFSNLDVSLSKGCLANGDPRRAE